LCCRYDEWIQPERIVNVVERSSPDLLKKKPKDTNSPKAQKPQTALSLTPQQQVILSCLLTCMLFKKRRKKEDFCALLSTFIIESFEKNERIQI
jgi:hypothetical protein